MTTNQDRPRCSICGKPLSAEKSVTDECGPLCARLKALGCTAEILKAHVANFAAPEDFNPENYVKVAQLHRICQSNGIPVNKMVLAFGRDRVTHEPLNDNWKLVYHKRARYLPKYCATSKGLAELQKLAPDFGKTQKINPLLIKRIGREQKLAKAS